MSRAYIPLSAIVDDYMLLAKEEDRYDKHISFSKARNLAVSGLREMQFDVSKTLNALVLDVDESTESVELPSDYLQYTRIGFLGADGEFFPLGQNNNMGSINQEYLLDNTGAKLLDSDNIEITAYYQSPSNSQSNSSNSTFGEYLQVPYRQNKGGIYGAGGGRNKNGSYRVDKVNGRIFFSSGSGGQQVVLEYIADESMSSNPRVPSACENAIKAWMYLKFIENKSSVPAIEKQRAEKAFSKEKRKSRGRMNVISKSEIFQQESRRFQLAAKLPSRVYR